MFFQFLIKNEFFQGLVNGNLGILQNTSYRADGFVSSKVPVNHTIQIKESDSALLTNAAYSRVYWFIDCQYIGEYDSMSYFNNYTKENEKFVVEALLMASYEPVRINDVIFLSLRVERKKTVRSQLS